MFFWFNLLFCSYVVCFCCVRFSFFSTTPTDCLLRTSLKSPILCRVGRKTLISESVEAMYYAILLNDMVVVHYYFRHIFNIFSISYTSLSFQSDTKCIYAAGSSAGAKYLWVLFVVELSTHIFYSFKNQSCHCQGIGKMAGISEEPHSALMSLQITTGLDCAMRQWQVVTAPCGSRLWVSG